jgi:hypothetical protein
MLARGLAPGLRGSFWPRLPWTEALVAPATTDPSESRAYSTTPGRQLRPSPRRRQRSRSSGPAASRDEPVVMTSSTHRTLGGSSMPGTAANAVARRSPRGPRDLGRALIASAGARTARARPGARDCGKLLSQEEASGRIRLLRTASGDVGTGTTAWANQPMSLRRLGQHSPRTVPEARSPPHPCRAQHTGRAGVRENRRTPLRRTTVPADQHSVHVR